MVAKENVRERDKIVNVRWSKASLRFKEEG